MKIGIDIDGVLTDVEKWQFEVGSKFFSERNIQIKNPNGFGFCEIFNVGNEEYNKVWNKYRLEYMTKELPRKYASEVIKKLKSEGNEIIIITARCAEFKNTDLEEFMKSTTLKWLKDNNIYYDKIIFSEEDKLSNCLKNNISIMIEDKPNNINELSKKLPVICFNSIYNLECIGKNIIRAYSWYDVYMKIKDLNN